MKNLHLIAHCWSGDRDCYAKMLTAQLSSLLRWPPKCEYTLSICTARDDHQTLSAIEAFQHRCVAAVPRLLPRTELFRRAFGRNHCAKLSDGFDIVWFTDCDLLFGEGCLDALAGSDFMGLAYPRQQLIHRSHAMGDEDLATITVGVTWKHDPSRFMPHRMKFASGGVQIVDGNTGRRGYLDGTRWQQAVDPAGGFRAPGEDRVFRGLFRGKSTVLDIPNLFRLRHSSTPFEEQAKRLQSTA